MSRETRIGVGVVGLLGVLIAATQIPLVVGALLMLFSILVFVFGVVGLIWPSLLKLPNRLAAVWVFALAFGVFLGGGMLISPTERPVSESSGLRSPEELRRRAAARQQQDWFGGTVERRRVPDAPGSGGMTVSDPCDMTADEFGRLSQAEADRAWQACLEAQGRGTPEHEAAGHLRESADCLEFLEERFLDAVALPPAAAQREVNLVLESCGFAIQSYPGLSAEARALAIEAVEQIDMTAIEQVADRASLDRALGVVIAALRIQADWIEP